MGRSDSPLETLRRVRDESVSDARRALSEATLCAAEANRSLDLERTILATLEQERRSLELAPGSRLRVSELTKRDLHRREIEQSIVRTAERVSRATCAVEDALRRIEDAETLVVQALADRQVVEASIDERARLARAQGDERDDEDILDGFRARVPS